MKLLLSAAFALVLSASAIAAPGPTIVTPGSIHWMAGTGVEKGTQVAILTGDPGKAGAYAVRIRMPDGYTFAPHWHGTTENVTVLQGTLLVGLGDKLVPADKMVALPAGSYVSVPVGLHHFARAKGVTILQLTGMGPMSDNLVK